MAIKVGMISLGCSKNQVDGEKMLALLRQEGMEICPNAEECDAIIINTCGFIEDAKKESLEAIFETSQLKKKGRLKSVVVTGCLAERYRQELADEIPEADVVLGIGSNHRIAEAVRRAVEEKKRVVSFGHKEDLSLEGDRILANAPYYAYLKVAEGCSNRCSFCAIPLIRGDFRSRRMEDIVAEARMLADRGVKELNVVAQDTTRYGDDLYGKLMLPELLRQLCRIEKIHWVRILYCYPDRVTDELLDVMREEEKIVKYMDVPIQHVNGRILAAMNRRGDEASLKALCRHIREKVPGVVLRTTLIAGLPGETEEDFEELCRAVEEIRFERLGCFSYSVEEDTPAAGMEGQLDEEVKRRRADVVMEVQQRVAQSVNEGFLGRTFEVAVEGTDPETGRYFGRSYMDAPDIDTRVYFTSRRRLQAGDFVPVKVTASEGYDLAGEEVEA